MISSGKIVHINETTDTKILVSSERMAELIEAEVKLLTITRIAEEDDCDYGYRTTTSAMIDTILGIERKRKK